MEKGLISVDRWSQGSQAYLLTHLHSDHTSGLTSAWSRGPLFCSRITAKLFPFKFPDFDLSLLRVLEDGSWYSVPLVSPSSGSETVVQVMAIDAHHCPGAVMFLFRGNFGCLLYTGDFRWEADSERAKKGRTILRDALKNDVIDILYLDNTYCNPSYVFPSREVAAQQVVDIIASHPEHDIIIGIDSLGKEDLLIHISRKLKTKIWVWPERLQTMHLLGFHDIFTTKTTLTRIRAVPRYSFNIDTLESLNAMRPTIGIMPSGLPWVKPTKGNANLFGSLLTSHYRRSRSSSNGGKADEMTGNLRSIDRFHQYIYSVPYSDHSSFTEIQEFIELAKPINMKGIVSASACYVEPLYYFGRLCGVRQTSQTLYVKHEKEEEGKRVATNESKYCFRDFNPNAEKRKRKNTALGVYLSRVSALRRKRCGAKIVESESSI
ncbi:DNA repair metallo-beta-lactamase family protein putative isoform 1 [Tripterygium wilfordii]|uniref:Protein artemis n=1 Tax=Tripterygium wilfordii TaxID=458696 RepID=A0A7J7D558_TRIWF|nr:5' exonuclease Apollo [Tripterygium wilfordii]XP_038712891.1 5' exonuclease Apollo [Tripterygium wilfordii]KAF5741470.1 DNA repair metallo-beta-lactamase family protein putative isoform 1 [Tripterygium wilfordii]